MRGLQWRGAAAALGALVLAWAAAAPVASAHAPRAARGGEPILERPTKADTIAARAKFFGSRNVDRRTGAVRRDRVILSWFGNTGFAMAIRGRVILLDAWVPRGGHSGYVPTNPTELAALRPKLILIGHAHFDHAADATPLALATGARLVGTAEHCFDLQAREPAAPPPCVEALAAGAAPGTRARLRLLRGVEIDAVKHLHSATTAPDGYHVPVLPFPGTTVVEHPPTPEDVLHTFDHLPDAEGGSVLYRFRAGRFSLVWHDSSGPLIEKAPAALAKLRRLRPVDVHVGAIQGFNQYTNGMRDPRTYIEALGARIFVPAHHDDWALPGVTAPGERYRPYLEQELELIPAAKRPRVRFIADPHDYVRPRALTFRLRLGRSGKRHSTE